MIIAVAAQLKEIMDKAKQYPWPRPGQCPRCHRQRVWGHGFVEAWFDECHSSIYLRRYRCPECGCVIRLKPKGYFKRFQTCIEAIRRSIGQRLLTGGWSGQSSRSRCGHWLRSLRRKAKAYFGNGFGGDLLEAFDRLYRMGKVPVSRAI